MSETPTINIDQLAERIIAEIQKLETEVARIDAELRRAREKLAAERGKLDLLAELQREALAPEKANGVEVTTQ